MLNLYCKFKALLTTRDRGMTAVEYALILFGIVAVVATIIYTFGAKIDTMFTDSCKSVNKNVAC